MQHKNYRSHKYSDEGNRQVLRHNILNSLITSRYSKDTSKKNSIGLLPSNPEVNIKQDSEAYIVIGLPASGKSSVADKIANEIGGMILDSDIAKIKFPEYSFKGGASLVHDESRLLTFGPGECVLQYCLENKINMIIPKIGDNPDDIRKLRDSLIKFKNPYKVHLVLVSLDRELATRRAIIRFQKTKRYVPLSLIYDGYANNPMLSYFRIKFDKEWSSTTELDNSGSIQGRQAILYSKGNCIYSNNKGVCYEPGSGEKKISEPTQQQYF
jgi:hypothetical protein